MAESEVQDLGREGYSETERKGASVHHGSLIHSLPLSCLMTTGDKNDCNWGSTIIVTTYTNNKENDVWGWLWYASSWHSAIHLYWIIQNKSLFLGCVPWFCWFCSFCFIVLVYSPFLLLSKFQFSMIYGKCLLYKVYFDITNEIYPHWNFRQILRNWWHFNSVSLSGLFLFSF